MAYQHPEPLIFYDCRFKLMYMCCLLVALLFFCLLDFLVPFLL